MVSATTAFILYFMPSIIALLRNRANGSAIIVINLFFGWTIIGWIIALKWAISSDKRIIIIKQE